MFSKFKYNIQQGIKKKDSQKIEGEREERVSERENKPGSRRKCHLKLKKSKLKTVLESSSASEIQ